jgi:hypothetical protein
MLDRYVEMCYGTPMIHKELVPAARVEGTQLTPCGMTYPPMAWNKDEWMATQEWIDQNKQLVKPAFVCQTCFPLAHPLKLQASQ